jgi:hypothetical protein
MYSGKQGSRATLLEAHGIITRETCDRYSLNVNNLGKATMLHFTLAPSVAGLVPTKLSDFWT